jgi:methionyl-tRNA formyltransferase
MGTPDFAVPTLDALAGAGHEVVAVYSRAPQPAGRGLEPRPAPVAREAERLALPVFTPKTLRGPRSALPGAGQEAAGLMRAHGADAAVVVAYGLMLPKAILDAFALGCFNVHASLLPRWRGAAPIHRAIMAGDCESGVTIMKLDEGLDTGPIAMAQRVAVGPDMTTGELHETLKRLGADLMLRALAALERGTLQLAPQPPTGVTYAGKVEKDETRIDWRRPWQEVHNRCRGLSPFPGAWCEFPGVGRLKTLRTTKGIGEGEPGRVLDDRLTIACGTGSVRIVELQRAGAKPLSADQFLRGTPIRRASVLT